MERLSYDSLAETDVVRRFPTSAKVFVFASAGPGLEPKTSRTATARSSHSATEAPRKKNDLAEGN